MNSFIFYIKKILILNLFRKIYFFIKTTFVQETNSQSYFIWNKIICTWKKYDDLNVHTVNTVEYSVKFVSFRILFSIFSS